MEPTSRNAHRVLELPLPELQQVISTVIPKFKDPSTPIDFLRPYTDIIATQWRNRKCDDPPSWDEAQRAWVDAGYIEAVVTLNRSVRTDPEAALTSYYSWQSLIFLMIQASVPERQIILEQFEEHKVLDICLDKMLNHELCLHQYIGARVLRALCAELFLGATLTSHRTAEILEICCRCSLSGPGVFDKQLQDPRYTWQSEYLSGQQRLHRRSAGKYGKRFYANLQDFAMSSAHSLIVRYPNPSKRFILEVIQHKPDLVGLLLECANIRRPDCYPEILADNMACELLLAMFQFPRGYIPGRTFTFEEPTQAEEKAEYDATIYALEILASRPRTTSKIIRVLKKLQEETYDDITRMLHHVILEYPTNSPPDETTTEKIFGSRGSSRSCMLRLVTNMTYTKNMKATDALAYLRSSYLAIHEREDPALGVEITPRKLAYYMELDVEVCQYPTQSIQSAPSGPPSSLSPPQETIGPIAYLGLLTHLAHRGLLSQTQTWGELPQGTHHSVRLDQLKAMTSPQFIKRIVSLSLERIASRRSEGQNRLRAKQHFYAQAAYISGSELASTILAFNEATQGEWVENSKLGAARKELVLNLGNAAEMSIREGDYGVALRFASEAVAVAQSATEVVTRDTLDKNIRRISHAKQQMDSAQS